ncbi:DEGP2 [Symbiodinium sp. KB8]|nr:DEGP2 [Symbiodinium sp. KB8]
MVKFAVQGRANSRDQELVVLTQVLAHELTVGYDHLENMQLLAVGGVPVRNLRHAVELTEAAEGPYLRFSLQQNQVLILRAEPARASTAEVLVKHGIPQEKSPDLQS